MVKRARWLALALLPACAAYNPVYDFDGGGPTRGVDDASIDAGLGPAPADAGAVSRGEYDPSDLAGAVDTCSNGVDDDGNGSSDCEDPTCREHVAACCVGAGDAACCAITTPDAISITSCPGPAEACAETLAWGDPFGSPGPNVAVLGADEAQTFVPGGQGEDAGLLGREVIDVRASAIRIEADVAASHVPIEGDADALGVGLVDATSASTLTHVTPIVAFMVSGSRGELSFIVAGSVVRRWPLADDGFHRYSLTIRPGSSIELARDGSILATASLPIDRALAPIVYGRTFNPGPAEPPPARLSTLAITRGSCDVPAALSRAGVILPPASSIDPGWSTVSNVRSPSVARWTDTNDATVERMAIEIDGAIYLAQPSGDAWELTSAIGAPALAAQADWAADGLGDPALVFDEGLELWFTGRAGDASSVARVRAAAGTESFAWSDVEVVLTGGTDASFSDPAPFARDGQRYVVVREDDGTRGALALYRVDGAPARVGELRAPSDDDLFAFDRDEVAAPAVVTTGTVSRLFFAGRRGLRWSIGELVSPNGSAWYEPASGPLVLEASGAGFDALGVRDPSPVFEGGSVRLYYTGLDGTRAQVGLAVGPAPPER